MPVRGQHLYLEYEVDMAIAWIDIVILALIVLSAILSLFRGFVKEALALATWLVALWVAMSFYEPFAEWLSQWITLASAQKITAFALLFVCVLLLGAVVNYLASKLVSRTGLTGTDKMLGIVFGIARGGVIVAILVLLAGLTARFMVAGLTVSRLLRRVCAVDAQLPASRDRQQHQLRLAARS